ncbi:MAG: decarboxylating 6-phosphogluconate dehydrogenase [Chloroflexi bacterium]|nr:decarboxylating 6-phosphogluconate dehydrogenase [Chloroflexota bacterium]
MQIGLIGLGKMGLNIATRLMRHGHSVAAYDANEAAIQAAQTAGAIGAHSLAELVQALTPPRSIWLMVPAGDATEQLIAALTPLLQPGDTLIDGGNSNYKDSIRHADQLAQHGLHFLDIGTSGGIWGLTEGYCLMIGGEDTVVAQHRSIFEALAPAPDRGWGHVGPHGAGHYAKMVHNGIEYGLMQAYAEGFEILHSKTDLIRNVAQVAELWKHGSVVRSWLLELSAAALHDDSEMAGVRGYVPDSGEGRWTIADAIDLDVPTPVITLSLIMRLASRQEDSYAAKLLAVMRQRFGGHGVARLSDEAV